jgi:hypothetical protein
MTKVEELRESLIAGNKTESYVDYLGVTHTAETFHRISVEELDAVIAASRAEGVEEERERIRNAPDVTFVGGAAMNWHFDSRKWYIIPYSVLAPKEKP